MKKKVNKKLLLNKSTISNLDSLNREQLNRVVGGTHVTYTYFDETCVFCDTEATCTFTLDYFCDTTATISG